MNNEAKFTLPNGHRRLFLVAITLVSLAGIALRLYPSSTFHGVGYDEELYRGYVHNLISSGLASYPDFAEGYVERQQKLPAAILPPTRFLYIFTAYLWHQVTGDEALVALHRVSCLFSILMLFAAGAFVWRLAGPGIALAVLTLMACAPTQIHMSQHALIDGFFAFWATLSLWFLWENLRQPNNPRWLILYTLSLGLMVMTKENALFAYAGLLALILANRWLRFGTVTRPLLLLTLAGPLLGVVILIALCGSATTFINTYRLLVAKASVLPYAIATGDGPWYRYLLDLLLVSPLVFLARVGRNIQTQIREQTRAFPHPVRHHDLSFYVQRPLRNESALHQHVGYAPALPCGPLSVRCDPDAPSSNHCGRPGRGPSGRLRPAPVSHFFRKARPLRTGHGWTAARAPDPEVRPTAA